MKRGFWILKGLKFIVLIGLFIFAAGFVVMSLWNWLIPALFAGPVISFWQALGLFALSKILFGGFHKHGHHGGWKHRRHYWKEKMEHRMANMTEEQREEFRKRWRSRCGGWEKSEKTEEGKQ